MTTPGEGNTPDDHRDYMWRPPHNKGEVADPFIADAPPHEHAVDAHLAIISLRQTQSLVRFYGNVAAAQACTQPTAAEYLGKVEDAREAREHIRLSHYVIRSAERLAESQLAQQIGVPTAHSVLMARLVVNTPGVVHAINNLSFYGNLFQDQHPSVIADTMSENMDTVAIGAVNQHVQAIREGSQEIDDVLARDPFTLAVDMTLNRDAYFASRQEGTPSWAPTVPRLTHRVRHAIASIALTLHQTLVEEDEPGYSVLFPDLIHVHAELQECFSKATAELVYNR